VASCSELISSGFENASATYASSGTDEKFLFRALADDSTIEYEVRDWNDEIGKPWSEYSLVLVRTTWDYSKSEYLARRFKKWLERLIKDGVKVLNHPLIMQWNMHKSYLSDLGARGVPVIPTKLVAAGSTSFDSTSLLSSIMKENNWTDVMIKPAIGGGSRACLRVFGTDVDAVSKGNDFLLSYTCPKAQEGRSGDQTVDGSGDNEDDDDGPCDMLVQPYLSSVEAYGEISVIVIDGVVTHLVQKKPVEGDFRTQEEWGASISTLPEDHPMRVTASNLATKILSIAKDCVEGARDSNSLLYARVDFLTLPSGGEGIEGSGDSSLVLLELELIEPCLFLANSESNDCARRIVEAIKRELSR